MSEKRKLTEYEKRMIASAYNLKMYCMKQETCENCIFDNGIDPCLVADSCAPDAWNLWKIGGINEKE